MFESFVISIIIGSFGFITVDNMSDYKGNVGIVEESGERVCILKDSLSYYLVRYDNGDKASVRNNTVKPIDELCI